MILVHCDNDAGLLTRYETGGEKVRLTHRYSQGAAVSSFDWAVLQEFRLNPPEDCSVVPPPRPTLPPMGSGIIFGQAA